MCRCGRVGRTQASPWGPVKFCITSSVVGVHFSNHCHQSETTQRLPCFLSSMTAWLSNVPSILWADTSFQQIPFLLTPVVATARALLIQSTKLEYKLHDQGLWWRLLENYPVPFLLYQQISVLFGVEICPAKMFTLTLVSGQWHEQRSLFEISGRPSLSNTGIATSFSFLLLDWNVDINPGSMIMIMRQQAGV